MPNPGPALDWTEDDLTRLATVTPDTVTRAQAWWRQRAPRQYRDVLDGGSADVPHCLAALDAVLHASEQQTRALADQLAAGALDTAGWQLAMADEVIYGHCAAVAAARGGWAHITLQDVA